MPPLNHKKYSASKAERWMNCPAAPRLCAEAPKMPPSTYAKEGTVAASIAEQALKSKAFYKQMNDLVGKIKDGIEIDDEMIVHVSRYVDYITSIVAKVGGELLIEQAFDLSHIHPELGGTTDAALVAADGGIHVWDLKYGKGKSVYAENNKQLLVYALGAAYKKYHDYLILYVLQPRQEDWIRPWDITPKMLADFETEVRKAIDACEKPDAQPVAGDWCQWCEAAGFCPARRKLAYNSAMADFDDPQIVKLPVVDNLTDEQLEQVLDSASLLESFCTAVRAVALARANAGVQFKNYKLVKAKSNRVWLETAEEFLKQKYGDKAYNLKIKSPAQIEKMDKAAKEFTDNLTIRPDKGCTLARIDDKREGLPASAESDFIEI